MPTTALNGRKRSSVFETNVDPVVELLLPGEPPRAANSIPKPPKKNNRMPRIIAIMSPVMMWLNMLFSL